MPILRIQEIGAGRDFPTPQTWFNSNIGNLVSSGLICIGIIRDNIDYSGNGVVLSMVGGTTNQEHFYKIQQDVGKRINITSTSGVGAIYCNTAYTKIQGIHVAGISGLHHFPQNTAANHYRYGIYCDSDADGAIVDGCLIKNWTIRASGGNSSGGTQNFRLVIDGIKVEGSGCLIRNSYVENLTAIALPNPTANILSACSASVFGIRLGNGDISSLDAAPTSFVVNNTIRGLRAESHFKPSGFDNNDDIRSSAIGIGIYCNHATSGNYHGFVKNNAIFDMSHWMSGISNEFAPGVVWHIGAPSGRSACFYPFSTYSGFYPPPTHNAVSDTSVPNDGTNLRLQDVNNCLLSTGSAQWAGVAVNGAGSPLVGAALHISNAAFSQFTSTNHRLFYHDIRLTGSSRGDVAWDIGAWEYELDPIECFDANGICIPGASFPCGPCDPIVPPGMTSGWFPLYMHAPQESGGYLDLFIACEWQPLTSGIDLYTGGLIESQNNNTITLFAEGSDPPGASGYTGFVDLFILTTNPTDESSGGNMNLFLQGDPIPSGYTSLFTSGATWTTASGVIPLSLNAVIHQSGYLNLYISGIGTSGIIDSAADINKLNLFLKAVDLPSGTLPMTALGNVWTAASGDTVPLHTISTVPVSGDSPDSTLNLYINGIGTSGIHNSYLNLYVQGLPIPSGTLTLFTEGSAPVPDPTWTTVSKNMTLFLGRNEDASGIMNLFILGPDSSIVNSVIPLFIEGTHITSGVDLYTYGKDYASGTMNLVVGGGFPTVFGSGISLFTWGTSVGVSGLFGTVPLFVYGTGAISSMNLYLASADSAIVTSNLNLFTGSSLPIASAGIDLFAANFTITSGIPLWVGGSPLDGGPITDLNDGWNIGTSTMNLYIETNTVSSTLSLYVLGPGSPSSGLFPLFINAISGVLSSNVTLYTRADPSETIPLYTHGF